MNFLGMGPGELILILIIALIVFGPGKLPELGRSLGKAVRDFREMSQGFTAELNKEFKELEEATKDIQQTAQTLQQVAKLPQSLPDMAKQAVLGGGEETPAPTKAEPVVSQEETAPDEEKPETSTAAPGETEQEEVEEISEEEMI